MYKVTLNAIFNFEILYDTKLSTEVINDTEKVRPYSLHKITKT